MTDNTKLPTPPSELPETPRTRDISSYVAEIKEKKEKENKEVTDILTKATEELAALEAKVKPLLDELFDIQKLTEERCKEIIETLKPLSKERVKLEMAVYKAESRLKQLKYL